MTDRESFLHAIAKCPEDDTTRLVFADWLEEQAQNNPARVKCGYCKEGLIENGGGSVSLPKFTKCLHCSGSDVALDTSNRDRAELIRVQCELAKGRKYVAPPEILEIANSGRVYAQSAIDLISEKARQYDSETERLHSRSGELLTTHPEWLPTCPVCSGKAPRRGNWSDCPACSSSGRIGTLTRGFLEVVQVPTMPALAQPICRTCNDTCWIEVYHGDNHLGLDHCPDCGDPDKRTWVPTNWLRNLLAMPYAELIREVVAMDRQPFGGHGIGYTGEFGWQRMSTNNDVWGGAPPPDRERYAVPDPIFDCLPLLHPKASIYATDSPAKAISALGRAFVEWGRKYITAK